MKRLYKCSAYCDENILISYKTKIIERLLDEYGREMFVYYNYRSMTTMSHVRKYVEWLRSNGYNYWQRVQDLYVYAVAHKEQRYIYMLEGIIK